MHPSILAKRKAQAAHRIVEQGHKLVQFLVLDPKLAAALTPVGIKDRAAADMMQLEAIADLLDALQGAVRKIPVETAPEPKVHIETETVTPVLAHGASTAVTPPEVVMTMTDLPEDLPPPVLDDEPEPETEPKPKKRATRKKKS